MSKATFKVSSARDVARLFPEARILLELSPCLPDLDIDVEQMHRVLINLIENALEAAGDRAPITVRTETHESMAKLMVIDAGPGVEPAQREQIFQPYISTKQSGMGLGLAVVRSTVEHHGGHITVTDAPGGGAQFEIFLPVPEGAAKQPEVPT